MSERKKKKKWTIMILMSGKNNLFIEQLKVLNEIYSVGSSDNVDFIVLFDGMKGNKFNQEYKNLAAYHVKKDIDFVIDEPVFTAPYSRQRNLNNQPYLPALFDLIKKQFPARNYGFIYKGHGDAGKTDIPSGTSFEKEDIVDIGLREVDIEKKWAHKYSDYWEYLGYNEYPCSIKGKKKIMVVFINRKSAPVTYADLARMLSEAFTVSLKFVCMDCCWAMQIENAYTFAGVTDHFIASADQTPALGLGYHHLCRHFIKRPAIKAEEIGGLLVSIYYYTNYADYDSDIKEFREIGVSLTSMKLDSMNKFRAAFTVLCHHLIEQMKNNFQIFKMVKKARSNCLDYTYSDTDNRNAGNLSYAMFNIDLIWFLENLLFYNESDFVLRDKIFKILYILQNELTTGHLSSNYKKTKFEGKAVGGNGIAITFPKNMAHAKESTLVRITQTSPQQRKKDIRFYQDTPWKDFLLTYYALLEKYS